MLCFIIYDTEDFLFLPFSGIKFYSRPGDVESPCDGGRELGMRTRMQWVSLVSELKCTDPPRSHRVWLGLRLALLGWMGDRKRGKYFVLLNFQYWKISSPFAFWLEIFSGIESPEKMLRRPKLTEWKCPSTPYLYLYLPKQFAIYISTYRMYRN